MFKKGSQLYFYRDVHKEDSTKLIKEIMTLKDSMNKKNNLFETARWSLYQNNSLLATRFCLSWRILLCGGYIRS
jgi:hypothetical protein